MNRLIPTITIAISIAACTDTESPVAPTALGPTVQTVPSSGTGTQPGTGPAPTAAAPADDQLLELQELGNTPPFQASVYPHHSGVRFTISPSRATAGQSFTVTASVPAGLTPVSDRIQHPAVQTWVMEWYQGGYGQGPVLNGRCDEDGNWKTCTFTVPYTAGQAWVDQSGIADQPDTACWAQETWYGRTYPARCWDTKIVLKVDNDVSGPGYRRYRNVLCVGVHHPTDSNAIRRQIHASQCDQYIH